MFTFKIGIKSQESKACPKCQKHVPNAKGYPKEAHGPRGRRGSSFAFCGVGVAVERGVCGVFCGANDNTLVLLAVFFFPFCFSRMWIPISRGVSDLFIFAMASITQISSLSSLRFFCACSSGDMTTPTAIVWRTVFKKPENCLQFSMEHVSFSFNARATEFSSHRRIWFLTEISLLNLFVLVFFSSFFIQCIWTVFQRCASRSAYIVVVVFFLKSPGVPQFFG